MNITNNDLRIKALEQIKSGKFERLYPLLERMLPIKSEEAWDIINTWKEQGFEQLCFFYYIGLLGNNLDAIANADALYKNYNTLDNAKIIFRREETIKQIMDGDCFGNLSILLLSIYELNTEEKMNINFAWKKAGNVTLWLNYKQVIDNYLIDQAIEVDEAICLNEMKR